MMGPEILCAVDHYHLWLLLFPRMVKLGRTVVKACGEDGSSVTITYGLVAFAIPSHPHRGQPNPGCRTAPGAPAGVVKHRCCYNGRIAAERRWRARISPSPSCAPASGSCAPP